MKLFSKDHLQNYLREKGSRISWGIECEDKNKLLNINEAEYCNYLIQQWSIQKLELFVDKLSVSDTEGIIKKNDFGDYINVKRQIVFYHLPFRGNTELLEYVPSNGLMWSHDVDLRPSEIIFSIINMSQNPETVKREADSIIKNIKSQVELINKDINDFNSSLEKEVLNLIKKRKAEILKQSNMLAGLGVPIRRSESVPSTFSIPVIKKKPIIKPEAPSTAFPLEPSLDETTYHSILEVINDVGKQMEKYPSTYKGKDEEGLRDQFLLYLDVNFEGSATGETFNKSGKTDILLRYKGNNVFVAECKYWDGQKNFLAAINQLLKYLTWRDSKAAVIIFVRNADFTNIIATMKKVISEHNNYIRFIGSKSETLFNYSFHLPGDKAREVSLAVILFHFPD